MFLLKLCLILAAAAGATSAVTVPVVFHLQGKSARTDSSRRGGQSAELRDLKMCTSDTKDSVAEVSYGTVGDENICWELEESSSQSSISDQGEKFSSLFKTIWGKQTESWSNKSYGEWKDVCSSLTVKWAAFSSGEDGSSDADEEEYLGLCSDNQVENTPFVKKKKEKNTSDYTFQICTSSCWTISETGSHSQTKELQSINDHNWKTVKFFKQKVS